MCSELVAAPAPVRADGGGQVRTRQGAREKRWKRDCGSELRDGGIRSTAAPFRLSAEVGGAGGRRSRAGGGPDVAAADGTKPNRISRPGWFV